MKALRVFKVVLTPFNLDNILFTGFEHSVPSNQLEIIFLKQVFKNKSALHLRYTTTISKLFGKMLISNNHTAFHLW